MLPLCLCYGMQGLFFQFMHKFQKMEISIDLTGLRMFHAPVQNMLTVWTGFAENRSWRTPVPSHWPIIASTSAQLTLFTSLMLKMKY